MADFDYVQDIKPPLCLLTLSIHSPTEYIARKMSQNPFI